jgi:hypothetical protein
VDLEELWYGVDKTMVKEIPMFYRMKMKRSEKVIKSK